MSFLDKVQRGKQRKPRRTVIYGTHGIGKTTWAAQWPSPIVIQTEDGCSDLDVASFPLATELMEAWQPIIELGGSVEHEFKTLVIDSVDWLEILIHAEVCKRGDKKAITDFDYGKGYGSATKIFDSILKALNCVRDAGMHVVLIGHCEIKKFTEPGLESYDRYTPKLHKDASALVQEWADEVLFANYKRMVRSEDQGFGKKRGIAIGGNDRILYTTEGPGHLAKNRLGLPDEITMDFAEYQEFLG